MAGLCSEVCTGSGGPVWLDCAVRCALAVVAMAGLCTSTACFPTCNTDQASPIEASAVAVFVCVHAVVNDGRLLNLLK